MAKNELAVAAKAKQQSEELIVKYQASLDKLNAATEGV